MMMEQHKMFAELPMLEISSPLSPGHGAWKLVKHAAPSLRDRGRQTPSAFKPPKRKPVGIA
jgi:hypothetical protein